LIQVQIVGLDKLVGKLKGDTLLGKPLREAFTKSAALVERGAKQRAPVDINRLRSSITHAVDTAPVPLWGKVGTRVFYAPYQEFGTSRGVRPKKYLRGALEASVGSIKSFFDAAARAIESAWGK